MIMKLVDKGYALASHSSSDNEEVEEVEDIRF